MGQELPATRRPGVRLRPHLPHVGTRHHLRRDGPGRETRDQPPRRRLREAEGGAAVTVLNVPAAHPAPDAPAGGLAPLGVYVHWPYCARICPYCDFNVVRDRGRTDEQAALARAIVADPGAQAALTGRGDWSRWSWRRHAVADGSRLGARDHRGGAAAVSPAEQVGDAGGQPTDAEAGRRRLRRAGVDRLSWACSRSRRRAALPRAQPRRGVARRAAEIGRPGFPRLSLDLIYALPGQTRRPGAPSWTRRCARAGARVGLPADAGAGTAFDARSGAALTPVDADAGADLYETNQARLGEPVSRPTRCPTRARRGGALAPQPGLLARRGLRRGRTGRARTDDLGGVVKAGRRAGHRRPNRGGRNARHGAGAAGALSPRERRWSGC